jgi:PAS domain S-box-containing protein
MNDDNKIEAVHDSSPPKNSDYNEQFRLLAKYSADIIYKMDIASNRYTYVSPSVERILGYTSEEALLLKPDDVVTPESYHKQLEAMQLAIRNNKSEPETLELYACHKQGYTVPMEVKANFVFDASGKPIEIVGIARDITKRRKAEAALKERDSLFRGMFNNTSIGFALINKEGRVIEANDADCRFLGDPREELIGMHFSEFNYPEDLQIDEQLFKSLLDGERDNYTVEKRYLTKQNEIVWGRLSVSCITNNDNLPEYTVVMCEDITKSKYAELELQKAYHKEVELREELENELERRVEFTRTLVHELKTPLTPMIAASDLLLEEMTEGPLFRVARSIQKGAQTLSKRIDMLLDMAKGEMGILEIVRRPSDLTALIKRIVEDMTPLSLARNIQLQLDVPDNLPEVSFDEERIRQVFINLLDNSFKFTGEEGTIILRARLQDSDIAIEVEDNGLGISEDEQKYLFHGYKLSTGKTGDGKGLGLGLALSKSIIELHGGKIQVESRVGEGSKFSFTLPLKN